MAMQVWLMPRVGGSRLWALGVGLRALGLRLLALAFHIQLSPGGELVLPTPQRSESAGYEAESGQSPKPKGLNTAEPA
jgi:hypothetical protein